jgi:hypothetical protein
LLRDYTGVAVMMPTMPQFLYENVEMLQAHETNADEQTKEVHQVQVVSLLENKLGQIKKVTYRFPIGDNMTCNNKNFNVGASGDFDLEPKLCILPTETGKKADGTTAVTQIFPYVFWEMAIDGETCCLANKKATSNADDIEKALAGMKF